MFTNTRKHLDVAIAGLLFAVGASGFYGLKHGMWGTANPGFAYSEEARSARMLSVFAGSILKQKGNIKFRFNDSALWHEMDSNSEKVSFGDAVFTAKDGQALLQMKAGQQIEIMPDSLVVMNKEADMAEASKSDERLAPIQLKKGHVKITYKKEAGSVTKPILVEVQGTLYQFTPIAANKPSDVGTEDSIEVVASAENSNQAPEIKSTESVHVEVVTAQTIAQPEVAQTATQSTAQSIAQAVTPDTNSQAGRVPASAAPADEVKPATTAHAIILNPGESFREKVSAERVQSEPAAKTVEEVRPSEVVAVKKAVHAKHAAQPPMLAPDREPASEPVAEMPAAKPVEQTVSNQLEPSSRGEAFSLEPYFNARTLNARDTVTGGTSKINSSADFGIDAVAYQAWSAFTKTFVHFKIGSISFEPPTSASKSLTDSGKVMYGFGLGVTQALTSRLSATFTLDDQKALFMRALSTNSVTVDGIMTLATGLRVNVDLIKAYPFTLGLAGEGHLLMPASTDSYSTKLGNDFGGVVYFRRELSRGEKLNYQFELGFTKNNQNSTIVEQDQNITTFKVRVFFPETQFESK